MKLNNKFPRCFLISCYQVTRVHLKNLLKSKMNIQADGTSFNTVLVMIIEPVFLDKCALRLPLYWCVYTSCMLLPLKGSRLNRTVLSHTYLNFMKTMFDALDLNSVANEFVCVHGSHSGCLGYMVPTWGWNHHALVWYIAIYNI